MPFDRRDINQHAGRDNLVNRNSNNTDSHNVTYSGDGNRQIQNTNTGDGNVYGNANGNSYDNSYGNSYDHYYRNSYRNSTRNADGNGDGLRNVRDNHNINGNGNRNYGGNNLRGENNQVGDGNSNVGTVHNHNNGQKNYQFDHLTFGGTGNNNTFG